jgi:hypothetical protein
VRQILFGHTRGGVGFLPLFVRGARRLSHALMLIRCNSAAVGLRAVALTAGGRERAIACAQATPG